MPLESRKKAAIFDLDGTLCDTLQDLADCCNRALVEEGFPPHSVADYRYIVGNGIHKQIERAMPPESYSEEAALRVRTRFQAYYEKGFSATTRPYQGMQEALEQIKKQGFLLICFSNKPDQFTKDLCIEDFGETFSVILGNRETMPLKPDPTALLKQLEELLILPEDCFYCGDTGVDMQTAAAAGIPSIGALWGFRTKEELLENGALFLAEKPMDLPCITARNAK